MSYYEELCARVKHSLVFTLDKERDPTAYSKERSKLVSDLYSYLIKSNEQLYIEYGQEIFETAMECLSKNTSDPDVFIMVFMGAVKKKCKRERSRAAYQNMHGGIYVSDYGERIRRRLTKFMEANGIDYNTLTDSHIQYLADKLECSVDIIDSVRLMNDQTVIDTVISGDDDEEIDIFSTLVGEDNTADLFPEEGFKARLDTLRNLYENELQERQKPLFKIFVTMRLMPELKNIDDKFIDILLDYDFIDREMLKRKSPPMQCEIAQMLGREESSISNSFSTLEEKILKAFKR